MALRKVNDEIKEDHFVVISDDVKFVELANSKIDEYYNQKGIVFENEMLLFTVQINFFFIQSYEMSQANH